MTLNNGGSGAEPELKLVFFRGAAGLMIAADLGGPTEGPLVCMAHGGGQTRHSWKGAARRIAGAGYRVVSMDLRGHGQSGWASDGNYDLPVTAEDIVAVVRANVGNISINLVGASLGGLASIVAAPALAELDLRSVILVDVVPRVDAIGRERIQKFMQSNLRGFADLEEAADAVAAYRPGALRPRDPAGLMKNLRHGNDGRLYWHWDPARLNRPLPDVHLIEDCASKITARVLLVRGGLSDVVTNDGVASLKLILPQLEVVEFPQADHMVVGDDNGAFTDLILEYLLRVSPV